MSSAPSPDKAFAVVEFGEEDNLKIIPTKWIFDDSAKYPTKCPEGVLKKLVKNCVDADSSWKLFKMQIYCKTNSFMKAEKLLTLVQDASDREGDLSEAENGPSEKPLGKRQIKTPTRYASEEESLKKSKTLKPERGSIMKAKKKSKDASDVQSDSSDSNNASSFSNRKRKSSSHYSSGKIPSKKSVTHRIDPLHYYQEMLSEGADISFDDEDYIANASYQKKRKMLSRFNHQQMDGLSSDEELYTRRTIRRKFSKSPAMLSSRHTFKKDSFQEMKQLVVELLNVQEKTFLKVKDIEERQKRLQVEVRKIRELIIKPSDIADVPQIPDDLSLPIFTDTELENLNERLGNDKEFQTRFVQFLYYNTYGRNISSFLTACLKKIMTQNVAQLYSRLGRKGKKSFIALTNLYAAVMGAASLKFPDGTTDECSEKLGRALASSGDWEGRNRPPITITVVKQQGTEEENY